MTELHKFARMTSAGGSLFFRQLFESESSTFTYILGDTVTKKAIIIDPVDVTVERDMQVLKDEQLDAVCAVNTHAHADHVTGTALLMKKLPGCKSAISKASRAKAITTFEDGDKIEFGTRHVRVLHTPGHTSGCCTFVLDDKSMAFCGDTVLIGGCGRTDFQDGNAKILYHSVREKIFSLPEGTLLYPAHDYNGKTHTTIQEQRETNKRLRDGISESEFVDIMANLNLRYPKKIDTAVPWNMNCGYDPAQ